MQQTIFQEFLSYVDAGGWVMPPLIFLMVLLWYGIGYRFAALRRGTARGPRGLLAKTEKKMRKRKRTPTDGTLVRAARKGIQLRNTGILQLRPFLDDAFAEEEKELRKFDVMINTIVKVAPLIGLLGTVIGMIETFDSLGDMSLYSQSGGIAGGISQALFTTQMGLAVSIPGLIVNGILNRKQKDIETGAGSAQGHPVFRAQRRAPIERGGGLTCAIGERKEVNDDINISPLIDMVFILLIFFMVSTTFVKDMKLDLNRPAASSATTASTKAIRLYIDNVGDIYLDGEPVRVWVIQSRIRDLLAGSTGKSVLVVTDDGVPAGRLVEVIDQARLAGASDVGVATVDEAGAG